MNSKKKRNDTIDPAKTFADLMRMSARSAHLTQGSDLIQALTVAGCVLDTQKIRDEVRKDVYVDGGSTSWPSSDKDVYVDGGSTSWPSSDDDLWNAPPSAQETRSVVVTPAVYATKIPPHLDILDNYLRFVTPIILWMLRSFDATTIDSMYRLDDQFAQTIQKLYQEAGDARSEHSD